MMFFVNKLFLKKIRFPLSKKREDEEISIQAVAREKSIYSKSQRKTQTAGDTGVRGQAGSRSNGKAAE